MPGNATCPIGRREIEQAYERIWTDRRDFKGLGLFASAAEADNQPFLSPVSPAEALGAVRKMDPGTAPGPDGVRRQHLLRWDPRGLKLADLFNCFLLRARIPDCLKACRTTLIPKSTDEGRLADMQNWWPITVGSVILRAFSRIMARRLSDSCPTHPRQRGFVETHGCTENLAILHGLIRRSRSERTPLAVMLVDFAKAFDTVSHKHLAAALRSRGVDLHVRQVIQDSYRGSYIRIGTSGGMTRRLQLGGQAG